MYSIEKLMGGAIRNGASDLHLVVGVSPSVRRNGVIEFTDGEPMTEENMRAIVNKLLGSERMERLEHDREIEFSHTHQDLGRFRAAIFYERGHLCASFRIVPFDVLTAEELALPPVVTDLARRTSGLLLIAGATGQGKTTTMNAIIDIINTERRARIITIEDPIEFVHKHKRSVVLQREVDDDTRSFNNALVAALRQDPNVICVGEMRDLETISTALTAAETGHLVISTLHTQSAAQTVNRIIDVFPGHQQNQVRMQLANTLQGVMCQKLLPLADGSGRILAYEIMIANQAVRHLIRDARIEQIHNALVTGREEGMIPLDHCLRSQYEQGLISFEVAISNALDPNGFLSLRPSRPF